MWGDGEIEQEGTWQPSSASRSAAVDRGSGTPPIGVSQFSARTTIPTWSFYADRQRVLFLAMLFLVTASSYFDYFVLSVLLDPIKQEFQVSDTMLGLLSGLGFALVYAIAGLPLARWADRGNRRTIISIALAGWSVMTALCGLAQSFWQLTAARFGVGALEAGALPPAHSLVADYFPPDRRATPIAILSMGASSAGYLLGVGLGGYLAAKHGWRSALLLAGVPGLLLAAATRLVLPEPRLRVGFPTLDSQLDPLSTTFAQLGRKRSYVYILLGSAFSTVTSSALSMFLPSFMIRTLHVTLGQVSATWGFAVSGADLVGALVGGWLAGRLSKHDVRWHAWLAGIATVAAIPIFWLALASRTLSSFLFLDSAAEFLFSIGPPATFCAIHAVCGDRRRAIAIAILQLSFILIGTGLGPLVAGAISDAFRSLLGEQSLRSSLMMMLAFLIPAAVAFFWAARALPQELEE